MVEVAIAGNGERLYPPFSDEDLQRVKAVGHLPHRPEWCERCGRRAEEIKGNDITQIMDRTSSAIKKTIELESHPDMRKKEPGKLADDVIDEVVKKVDEVVDEDLSNMYDGDVER